MKFFGVVLCVAACGGDDAAVLPDAPIAASCTPPTGAGTMHTAVTANETWTAAASPHVIPSRLSVDAGTTVTIEGCAVVRFAGDTGLLVEGSVVADGSATEPVTLERLTASEAWGTIEVRNGTLSLAYTEVTGGGDPAGGAVDSAALIDVRGDQLAATQGLLTVDHVTLRGSGSHGVRLREGGGFAPGSTALTITGSAAAPIVAWGRAAGSIPMGTYTGNAVDAIDITALGGNDDIQESATWKNLGVPYQVRGSQIVVRNTAAGGVTTWTLATGTTLKMADASRIVIDAPTTDMPATGAIVASGVTFTSSTATAGAWVGLVFRGTPSSANQITSARIEYAGAPSQNSSFGCPSPLATNFGNDGAIVIVGGKPATSFVTQTTITNSAGDGIVRGWTGDEVDFTATNTFTAVARCNQTYPKPSASACPATPPCPITP